MHSASFAVVAYLDRELAQFLNEFRAAATPHDRHLRPHLTLLPPRSLQISDADCLAAFNKQTFQAIKIEMGEVSCFMPLSPTVYLDLRSGHEQLSMLNHQLGAGVLAGKADWPYVPHLTLARLPDNAAASHVMEQARRRWRDYQGTRSFSVAELTLVREAEPGVWIDLASIHAGD